jgi:S-methyl-5-thioribose-1-phosphate isomerase
MGREHSVILSRRACGSRAASIEAMKVDGRVYRTIWPTPDGAAIEVIDQTLSPHRLSTRRIEDLDGAIEAIKTMVARGAPLIGATAASGLALALRRSGRDDALERAYRALLASRPTAVNLRNALNDVSAVVARLAVEKRAEAAWARAGALCDEDVARNRRIGEAGLPLIEAIHRQRRRAVNILTHCNAGWLATVDWGTATAPIYMAHDRGAPVHVFVDETRPRNQGATLTAFELAQHGVPHTVVVDNAGGHLMQRGRVDLVIVGADQITARRRRQQDRRLSQGSRGARPPRAVLRRGAAHFDRLDDPRRPCRNRDRGARPRRSDAYPGARRGRTACARGDRRRPAPRRPIRPST